MTEDRLLYVEDEPFINSESYLPCDVFPGLEKVNLQDVS